MIDRKEDIKNIEDIKKFLEENHIEYSTEFDNFCLFYNDPKKRMFEIEYANALDFPIAYPKYNIKGVDKDYFYRKSREAEDNNSFKFWIKNFEWANPRKREVMKSQIIHAYGATPNKFYARDCVVRKVEPKEGRAFEQENCFYGKRGASLSLGLYLKKNKNNLNKDTLLMLYTFGLNYFGKDNSIIEIIRVGTLRFSYVMGGASKLLKHFLDNYKTLQIGKSEIKIEKLKFYADYDHAIGGSMPALGFKFDSYSKGGFMNYWLNTGEVKAREPARHGWVMQQIALGNCISIPNAGVKTYVLERDKTGE
jgi:hypothetical protein